MKLTHWQTTTSKQIDSRMERARQVAMTGSERQRHGAILMQGSRVLAVGVNTFRNPPLSLSYPAVEASNHAEVAVTALHRRVPNTRLYLVRVNARLQYALSKPCDHCLDYLVRHTNVKEVIFS